MYSRDAVYGGRTERAKTFAKRQGGHTIFAFVVRSEYPTVNALDDYAVGFEQFYKPIVDEVMNDSLIGVVKCDVAPPTRLYILV